jgi:hypothetical protein
VLPEATSQRLQVVVIADRHVAICPPSAGRGKIDLESTRAVSKLILQVGLPSPTRISTGSEVRRARKKKTETAKGAK